MEPKAASVGLLIACAFLLALVGCGGSTGGESSKAHGGSGADRSADSTPATSTSAPTTYAAETTDADATKSVAAESGKSQSGEPGAGQTGKSEARRQVVVKIEGLAYAPSEITVSPGTTVRWANEDPADHTVTSEEAGGPLRSKVFREGKSFEYTFEETGKYSYYCAVHPFMKGSVVVE